MLGCHLTVKMPKQEREHHYHRYRYIFDISVDLLTADKVSADQYHMTILWAQVKSSFTSRTVFFLKLTADQVAGFCLDCGLKPGYFSGEKGGVHAKAEFRHKLNPDALFTFLPTYSLLHCLFLRKSLIYCTCNFYNLGYTRYGFVIM